MKKSIALTAAVLLSALFGSMVFAASNDGSADPAAGSAVTGQEAQTDQTTTNDQSSQQPVPGNAALSKHNKAMLDQAEQRKQRQGTIEQERAVDTAPRQ
jgi:hypothetical protein